ncbi:FAD:protein FMN transferase [Gilvibacter sp.]|uniref:FAD:protein FMN transferase n=1 Tax=Gilvibacter sp. TaxID=2729997 RepID=UPI003F4A186E
MNPIQWSIMVFKKLIKVVFGLFFGLMLIGCQEGTPQLHTLQGGAFGTTFSIKYFHSEKMDLSAGVDSVINAVNQSMSTYWEDSDITRINRGDSTQVTDAMFQEVYKLAQQIHGESDGYFDPTIGVLRNAYGFGDEKPLAVIDSTSLDSLMTYVGFDKVKLNADGTITKAYPQIYFDFNAIAKGYGIDRIATFMANQGLTDYIIELGGEVYASGMNLEKQTQWVAGIEAVDTNFQTRGLQAAVRLENIAMAASGNYRKFRVDPVSGKRYVHTLNPLTGSAETSDVTSATVLASTCAAADAYATTFMALGLEKSKVLLEKIDGVEAYLTYAVADSTAVFFTAGFEPLLKD